MKLQIMCLQERVTFLEKEVIAAGKIIKDMAEREKRIIGVLETQREMLEAHRDRLSDLTMAMSLRIVPSDN